MTKEHIISEKKIKALYNSISNDIMDARVTICRLLDTKAGKEVDNILSDLMMKAPQRAIDLFKKQQP